MQRLSPAPQVTTLQAPASAAEERAFDTLAMLSMSSGERPNSTCLQLKTTLLKTLFSSPMACLDTLRSRLHSLQRSSACSPLTELRQLRSLEHQLCRIRAREFSKYQQLLAWIDSATWDASDAQDRLIICTERLETLFFLSDRLQQDLGLDAAEVELLHAGLRLSQRASVVSAFQDQHQPVRLLLCADIASAQLRLHPLSHRLVHFDLPWSSAIIRQRNARIEHPGKDPAAQITYLNTDSRNPCVRSKQKILQGLLWRPAQPAPIDSAMLRQHCVRETAATAAAIERDGFVSGPASGDERKQVNVGDRQAHAHDRGTALPP